VFVPEKCVKYQEINKEADMSLFSKFSLVAVLALALIIPQASAVEFGYLTADLGVVQVTEDGVDATAIYGGGFGLRMSDAFDLGIYLDSFKLEMGLADMTYFLLGFEGTYYLPLTGLSAGLKAGPAMISMLPFGKENDAYSFAPLAFAPKVGFGLSLSDSAKLSLEASYMAIGSADKEITEDNFTYTLTIDSHQAMMALARVQLNF